MRTSKDFAVKLVRINGHRVEAIVPTKTISLEEGLRMHKRILRH